MNKKTLLAAISASAMACAVVVPLAATSVEAAGLTISDYVVQKDGKVYTISTEEYKGMKSGGVALIKQVTVEYLKDSAGNFYKYADFRNAKAAIPGGNMQKALDILSKDESSKVDLKPGKVVTDKNGDIKLEEGDGSSVTPPAVEEDFEVKDIY